MVLLLALLGTVSCVSWEHTLSTTVVPANELLHHRLPHALKDQDLGAALALHLESARPAARQQLGSLLEGFARIDWASCRIHTLDLLEDDRLEADLHLQLEGVDASEKKRQVAQRATVGCLLGPEGWQVASWEVTVPPVVRTYPQGPRFADEAADRGLTHRHASRGVRDRYGAVQEYAPGTGLAVRDVDGNGYEDVLLVDGGRLRLLASQEGVFQDVSDAWGISATPQGEMRFGVFGDVDNDGDPDLFVGVVQGPSLFFRQEDGVFHRTVADEVGIISSGEVTGACFVDIDRDGWLDLFVANGGNLLQKAPEPVYNADNGTPNQLFRNRGDGTFEDISEEAGIDDTRWALACQSVDFDRDGHTDLFVANDFGQDWLYRNLGDGTFEEVAEELGIVQRGSSMGASWGDLNGDGRPDLFVSAMAASSRWIVQQPGFPLPAPWPLSFILHDVIVDTMLEMFHGNRLYLQLPDGQFQEVSEESGTAYSGWAWAGIHLDYDNDGRQDLYVLNGFISGEDEDDL